MPAYRPVDPKQSFPELEQRILARWQAGDVFARSMSSREAGDAWVFNEGPPTANGKPGSHHVLARVFKDIYPRYQTMRGRKVPRKGGWDCHGLPVELEIEKRLGLKSKAEIEEYGIAEFNKLCRESVFEYVDDWNRLTERIGMWIDLDNAYFTLTNDYIESVWWSLKKVFDDGLLYRGHRVVPYCPRCGTSLSSHEVALGYQDVTDPTVYVRLRLVDSDESLLVWTTTPWTLPGNVAVAAGPDIDYARVRTADGEVVIVANDLVEKVVGEDAEILNTFKGSDLVGRRYEGPVFNLGVTPANAYQVIAGDFVTTTDGTGLVHIAPAFGEDDYTVAAAAGQFDPTDADTLFNPVTLDGNFDDRVIGFEGRFVKDPEVTEALIADLDSRGLVFRRQDYEHSYPHCWRCNTPLLYYAKSSWYVKTTAVRDLMLAENEKIGWQPDHIKHGRFGKWLENNQDWAISRERYWGTPLPIWECGNDECGHLQAIGSIADIAELGGTAPDDLHRPYIDDVVLRCPECEGEMRRVKETVDAWWDSGSMPFAQYHYPFENKDLFDERFPADFISEGIDQTRGWFYSLLAVSTLLFGKSAYRNCVCLGLILDPEGQKMSKSRGNVVDPWSVIDKYGADAFRWYYFTAQQPWAGYRFSVETLGETVNSFFTTLWNTYSFWVMYANAENLDAGDPVKAPAPGEGTRLDEWALSRLQTVTSKVITYLDGYDATLAGREIANFVDELSNWYVRLNRRRFWNGDRAALGTLRHCLVEIAKLLAPFTPFIADDIYVNLSGEAIGDEGKDLASVHLADFPVPDTTLTNLSLEAEMEAVRRTVELGRAARAQAKVKMRQPLARAVIVAEGDERAAIEAMGDTVRAELNVKELEFVSTDAELASYEVKPNYRSLGPRFGKNMPQVAAAVAALDPDAAAAAARGEGTVAISIDGKDHELLADDLLLTLKPLEGYEVEASAGRAVALSTDLDDDLLREGLAREVVHAVQNARKAAGLEITDRIVLSLGGDDELLEAAREHGEYIANEVLARAVEYGPAEGNEHTTETTIDGKTLVIGVERIDGGE